MSIDVGVFRSKRQDIRIAVWQKTNGRCYLCGCDLLPFGNEPNSYQIDHKQPVKLGGTHELSNLFPACQKCNHTKGTKSYEEFKTWIFGEYQHCKRWSPDLLEFLDREKIITIYEHIHGI
jgi:5-methylcytosine-specific restriction endonuclease McrA